MKEIRLLEAKRYRYKTPANSEFKVLLDFRKMLKIIKKI